MFIFSLCTFTSATRLSLLLLRSPHKHTFDLLVSFLHLLPSLSPLLWCICNLISSGVFRLSSLPSLPHCSPPTSSSATKVEYLVYNYSSPYCCVLLPSHPSPPSHPITSPPTPLNTPQINAGLIREGGDAEHIACNASRKAEEKAVYHLYLSISSLSFHLQFFSSSMSSSTQLHRQLLRFLLFFSCFRSHTFRCIFLGMGRLFL